MAVQYGFPERLCEPMQVTRRHYYLHLLLHSHHPPSTSPPPSLPSAGGGGGELEPEALLDAFASYAASSFYSTLETGSSAEYGEAYLRQTASGEEKSARAWLYQARRPAPPRPTTTTTTTTPPPRPAPPRV